jgi:hypothetical protein
LWRWGSAKWSFIALWVGCALPGIRRGEPDGGAAPSQQVASRSDSEAREEEDAGAAAAGGGGDDADAGKAPDKEPEPYDPRLDPANRNEDIATFEKMLSRDHVFAQWPMPDSTPGARVPPSYAATDKVITDQVTKLRWQRVLPEVYAGCTARYKLVGKLQEVGTGCTWEEAKAYCASPALAKELGGGTWRLPTKIELESIVDVTQAPAFDPLFETYPTDYFWSSSPFLNPEGLKLAWVVDFSAGFSFDGARYSGGRARCVSSDDSAGGREPDLEIIADVVVDRNTKLVWQWHLDSATRNWPEAKEYCDKLSVAGGRWRLPTLKELLTLVDPTRRRPATAVSKFSDTPDARFWTASQYVDGHEQVWVVNFERGTTEGTATIADQHYVRCVR